jgi:hypothetical protein
MYFRLRLKAVRNEADENRNSVTGFTYFLMFIPCKALTPSRNACAVCVPACRLLGKVHIQNLERKESLAVMARVNVKEAGSKQQAARSKKQEARSKKQEARSKNTPIRPKRPERQRRENQNTKRRDQSTPTISSRKNSPTPSEKKQPTSLRQYIQFHLPPI